MMNRIRIPEARRMIMDIEVLILAQLMKGAKHGYEIKKTLFL